MTHAWRYRSFLTVATIGLTMVGVGLGCAHLSNPARFPNNVRYDSTIHLLTLCALLFTLGGVATFVKAVSRSPGTMPIEMRRDVNFGFGLGFVLQFLSFVVSNSIAASTLFLFGLLVSIWGAVRYAQGKQLSKVFGILGLFGVFGLVVLILLPNRPHPALSTSMEAEALPMRDDRSPSDLKSSLRLNPYEPGQVNIDMYPPVASLLGRPMASLVGFFVGGISAGVVATVLTFVAIMPPIGRLLHLDGEFAGLGLIMMPPMAAGCGILSGLTLGLFYRHRQGGLIAGTVGSLPALLFYSQSYDSHLTDGWQDSPIPAIVESLIMLFAAVTTVFIVGRVFVLVERRRTNEKVVDESSVQTEGGITMVVTIALAAIVVYCGMSLHSIPEDESKPFPVIFSIITLALTLVAITAGVYLMAAHRCRRVIALECITVAIFAAAIAPAACYTRIWL